MTLREHLQKIYDEHGVLTPDLVVEVARPRSHPLHDHVFDRPIKEASEAWYKHRAHELIRTAKIVYREGTEEDGPQSVRAFHAVRGPDREYSYVPAEKIAADPLLAAMLLRDMEREWKALHRRFGHFAEFIELVRGDVLEEKVA